jgi:beta-glucosidase
MLVSSQAALRPITAHSHRLTAHIVHRLIAAVVVAVLAACAGQPVSAPSSPSVATYRPSSEERFVDSLLAAMTLDEKLGQLNQVSAADYASTPDILAAMLKRGAVGSLMDAIGADTTRALQRLTLSESRLRIPLLFADDVIHGFRTIFPIPLGEAASWDPSLAERTARIAATEAAANGIAWTYAPMVDVARDPRWGRIMEGSGEDPFLGAAFAAARVRGFQGNDLRAPTAIAATAKHFAAYGAAEGGRDYNRADISERTLHEVYFPPFRAAVCAGAQTLMASFNDIGGIPAHANRRLLTNILRDEWHFDGTVVSDWNGVVELIPHGVAGDRASAGALALHAGVDIDMVSQIYIHDLAPLIRSGRVPEREVDEAVRRVLRLKYRLGLFVDPYHGAHAARAQAVTLTTANRTLARQVARESIVLLENRGDVLPLRPDVRTVAVIGALASDSASSIGAWAARANVADAVTVLDGIRRAVSSQTRVLYARGASPTSDDTTGIAEAVRIARQANVVILVIGESRDMSGEASSRASLDLPGAQQRLAEAVQATGKPVVAVLMNGRPLAISWLHDHVPAILETWFGGVEAGNATADVLFGAYNPSGKLPVTFPRSVGQVPIYYAHTNTGRPSSADNSYTSKYIDLPWTPLYPFGYGLSYTTFTLGTPLLSAPVLRPGDSLDVAVDVTNTGSVAGAQVVQLYLRDDVASVTRPVAELRGFQRVHLAPHETKAVHFAIREQALAFYDTSMARVVEPGSFTVFTGDDALHTSQAQFRFETPNDAPARMSERCEDLQGAASASSRPPQDQLP